MHHHDRASQRTPLTPTPSSTRTPSPRHSRAPSPVSISYPIDALHKVTMQLDFADAVHYTLAECQTWLKDHSIPPTPHNIERWNKTRTHRLLLGCCSIAGVPIDDAVAYCLRRSNAHFKNNPYGLSSYPYWAIAVSMLLWSVSNLVNGFLDGFQVYERHPKAKVLTGLVGALPGVWMFILFLKPALIANVKDQYAAMGHII